MPHSTLDAPSALTRLTEDELIFRDSVYEFADREIRPLVRDMDEHAKIPRDLIDKLFSLGVMLFEMPSPFPGFAFIVGDRHCQAVPAICRIIVD